MTRALIIGNRGFVGAYLEDALQDKGYDIFGFDLKYGDDVRDYEKVRGVVDLVQPDYIFHLAAMAVVGESEANPWRAIETHVIGSLNILEACRQLNVRPKILLASTSEEYGYEEQTGEVTEKSPTMPNTIYGATKNCMANMGNIYAKRHGLNVVVTRAFNHIGAGKSAQFADTSWARQIALIEKGEQNKLMHGNLETVRNYTDVRDIVRGYIAAIDAEPGVYNVCSDSNVSMYELLESLVASAKCPITTEVDEHIYRPGTSVFHRPSYAKLNRATGWSPEISFNTSVADLLEHWRERIA